MASTKANEHVDAMVKAVARAIPGVDVAEVEAAGITAVKEAMRHLQENAKELFGDTVGQ